MADYVRRIESHDLTLTHVAFQTNVRFGSQIDLNAKRFIDALITHPNCIENLVISNSGLGDDEFVEIAQYVASSSSIRSLVLSRNNATHRGYLAIANALRTNSSLSCLILANNNTEETRIINQAFIDALRLNPRYFGAFSTWYLYDEYEPNCRYLRNHAERRAPPSMLEFLLCIH